MHTKSPPSRASSSLGTSFAWRIFLIALWVGCGDGNEDPCRRYTSCGTCTPTQGCGWCDGACASGTSSGPFYGRCGGSWSWTPAQCTGGGGGGGGSAGVACTGSGSTCSCEWSATSNGTSCNRDSAGGAALQCCRNMVVPGPGYQCTCRPADSGQWRCTQNGSSSNCSCGFNRNLVYSNDRYVIDCRVGGNRRICCATDYGCSCTTSSSCPSGSRVDSCVTPPVEVRSANLCPGGTSSIYSCRGDTAPCNPTTCTGRALDCCTSAGCVPSYLMCVNNECQRRCDY
jgi:hypothetical protein